MNIFYLGTASLRKLQAFVSLRKCTLNVMPHDNNSVKTSKNSAFIILTLQYWIFTQYLLSTLFHFNETDSSIVSPNFFPQ